MSKYKIDLDIPFDVQNDLVYCQRALANHIFIHQVIYNLLFLLVPGIFLFKTKLILWETRKKFADGFTQKF